MSRLILKHSFNHNGHRTAKMTMTKTDEYVQVWLSLGEKSCMIRLDDAMQRKIVEFLKIKD